MVVKVGRRVVVKVGRREEMGVKVGRMEEGGCQGRKEGGGWLLR